MWKFVKKKKKYFNPIDAGDLKIIIFSGEKKSLFHHQIGNIKLLILNLL